MTAAERIAEETDYETARKLLKDEFGVTVSNPGQGRANGIDESVMRLVDAEFERVGTDEFQRSVRDAYATLKDLRSRFPSFTALCSDLIVASPKHSDKSMSSAATMDRIITRHAVVIYASGSNFGDGTYGYGHGDARVRLDVLRHEIGHVNTTRDLLIEFVHVLTEMRKRLGRKGCYDAIGERVSLYAQYMAYDEDSVEEIISESFSRYTSEDYERGFLPAEIEEFMLKFLQGGKKTMQAGHATDSGDAQESDGDLDVRAMMELTKPENRPSVLLFEPNRKPPEGMGFNAYTGKFQPVKRKNPKDE